MKRFHFSSLPVCEALLALLVFLASDLPAFAHVQQGQAQGFLTGLSHPISGLDHVLLSADDLLPILAMSMLAGLNGPAAGRRTLFGLTGAWLLGGLAGYLFGQALLPGTMTCVSFLVLGGLTAADRRLSPAVVLGIAVAVGLLHGWRNGDCRSAARSTRARGDRQRDFCRGRACFSLRDVAACRVDADRSSRRRQLGGRHWLADARVEPAVRRKSGKQRIAQQVTVQEHCFGQLVVVSG
jgi:hydrogenase/urease accessory protein HupE